MIPGYLTREFQPESHSSSPAPSSSVSFSGSAAASVPAMPSPEVCSIVRENGLLYLDNIVCIVCRQILRRQTAGRYAIPPSAACVWLEVTLPGGSASYVLSANAGSSFPQSTDTTTVVPLYEISADESRTVKLDYRKASVVALYE